MTAGVACHLPAVFPTSARGVAGSIGSPPAHRLEGACQCLRAAPDWKWMDGGPLVTVMSMCHDVCSLADLVWGPCPIDFSCQCGTGHVDCH